MIARSRYVLSALLLMFALPLATAHAQAQRKPVAMLSISSIDSLLGNIQYLTEAAGVGTYGEMATMMANPYTQGLDKANPIGIVVTTDGEGFLPLAFIPVKDLETTLSNLEETIGAPRDLTNGIKEIPGPQPIFLKEQDGWAFIGQTVESLGELPKNPVAGLGTMPQDYDIALRGKIQNIPKVYLDMAVDTLKSGVEQGLEQLPEDERENQEKLVGTQLEQFETMIKESDEITLGWKTDPAEKRTYLDLTFTAVPGGKLATQMAMMADAKSDFTGFLLPDAALTMNMSSKIPPEQIKTSVDAIMGLKATAMKEIEKDDDIETEDARKAAKELLGAAVDIFVETLKTGAMDGGMSIVLKPKAVTVVGGFHVADGADVEQVLKRVADVAKSESDFPGIKFNADSLGGVAFNNITHTITQYEDARKILGETLEVAVGTSKDSAYFGLGTNCVAQLKSIIGSSAKQKPVAPFQLSVALKPVMQFIGSIDDNPLVGSVSAALDESGTKDHVKIRAMPINNGFTYRLELEEGVLRAIGKGIEMANAGGF